uniref:Uncharacterized protein n=1 Tax=Cyclophora tenuis TaxID=216820 RepID=A0A7S1GN15_CYCTE
MLSGTVPSELDGMSMLTSLWLHYNNLVGDLSGLCSVIASPPTTTTTFVQADCFGEITCPCCECCCQGTSNCSCPFVIASQCNRRCGPRPPA